MINKTNNELLHHLNKSTSCFHAIAEMKEVLIENGFKELKESEKWNITKGEKYFTIRNGSSVIAFDIPEEMEDYHFQITSSHSDSPTFKIKENGDLKGNGYLTLNTEGYGGMIASTWFDRPLSLSGRVMVKEGNRIVMKLLNIDRDLLVIPNLAIHMNRDINNGVKINNQIDMIPLFGLDSDANYLDLLAKELNVKKEDILAHDVYLYNRMSGTTFGANNEFIASPKLDDLQCAFTSLMAFVNGKAKAVNVYVCFDNEEVGSQTKQGAASTFLDDCLVRINEAFGKNQEDYRRAIAKSFMISCDNAHAIHPNHPEKTDKPNTCYLNKGIVIKHSANQKYTTDAISDAIFTDICNKAGAKVQHFSNRSDMVGGSTLGNISTTQVSLHTVDVGLPQLAMHSAYECAGSEDSETMVKALTYFYSTNVEINDYNDIEVH